MKVVRSILLIINLILAIGLLLTTLAGSVAPSRSLLPSVAAYGYLPLLAANVLMVLIWALMKRWPFLISVAAIALRWSLVGGYLQVGGTSKVPDREEHPQMVTLMTYNVHHFQGLDFHGPISDSVALEFLKLIHEHQPDVLCMQEVSLPKKMNIVDSLEVMGYNHYYGTHQDRRGRPYGTVVYSKMPITYVTRLDEEKLLVDLLVEGQKMRVCCVHMDSYQFDDGDRAELDRARHGEVQESIRPTLGKIRETILCHEKEWTDRLLPVVTESSVPLVVAGDMNDIPSSWLYRRLYREMSDCFREKGQGLSITYNGYFPQFRIDMVFHSEGLQTLSYRRIRCDVSDHYPVLTSLQLVP